MVVPACSLWRPEGGAQPPFLGGAVAYICTAPANESINVRYLFNTGWGIGWSGALS
jgi:hypothetical protein